MSRINASANLIEDFERFKIDVLKCNECVYKVTDIDQSSFRKFHKSLYTLSFLAIKLKRKYRLQYHKFVYLSEIVSDSLIISSLLFQGLLSSYKILHRRIIENFYNHIYYFNHEIEFELLEAGKNEYIPMKQLKEYIQQHPSFYNRENKLLLTNNQNIFNTYQELCKIVHAKGISSMNLAKNLGEIKEKNRDLNLLINETLQTLLSINYICFKFHMELSITPVEKSILASLFPKLTRVELLKE